jgi:hypothetical protein
VRAHDLLELVVPFPVWCHEAGGSREVGVRLLRLEGEAEGGPVFSDLRELVCHVALLLAFVLRTHLPGRGIFDDDRLRQDDEVGGQAG